MLNQRTMREEIANLVYPVLAHGMEFEGAPGGRFPARSRPGADGVEAPSRHGHGSATDVGLRRRQHDGSIGGRAAGRRRNQGSDPFLGIRYALVCWLDELFILDSPWSAEWNERKLEAALYGTNDRAWKFWDQAKRAESQQGSDALEVFFLCVMLGFRGDLREEATRLQAWVAGTQIRVAKSQAQEFTVPPELQPPTNVPPLRGRERLQRMVLIAGVVLLMLIPVVHCSAGGPIFEGVLGRHGARQRMAFLNWLLDGLRWLAGLVLPLFSPAQDFHGIGPTRALDAAHYPCDRDTRRLVFPESTRLLSTELAGAGADCQTLVAALAFCAGVSDLLVGMVVVAIAPDG